MTQKSIGQFISALRKSNGLTQAEMADRLNVSNKAVSRWERDESAPDITLIPAIAEMFGVTCDELLKGERIFYPESPEKKERKVEKQLKNLFNRKISTFKTLIWISIALSIIGLIFMIGITEGFYMPTVGFSVMFLFVVVSFVIVIIAINKMNEIKNENELFETADLSMIEKFNNCLGNYSFYSFFTILSVIFLSVPLFLGGNIRNALFFIIPLTLPILLLILFKGKKYLYAKITGQRNINPKTPAKKVILLMTLFQLSMIFLAAILHIYAPIVDTTNNSLISTTFEFTGLFLWIGNIICFIIFLIIYKDIRKSLILPGIRNVSMIVVGIYIMMSYTSAYSIDANYGIDNYYIFGVDPFIITLPFDPVYIILAIPIVLYIEVIYNIIKLIIGKLNRKA